MVAFAGVNLSEVSVATEVSKVTALLPRLSTTCPASNVSVPAQSKRKNAVPPVVSTLCTCVQIVPRVAAGRVVICCASPAKLLMLIPAAYVLVAPVATVATA